MSEQELALGQREVVPEIEFSPEELALIETNGHTADEIKAFVAESGVQTINAAIGGLGDKKGAAAAEADKPLNVGEEAAPTEGEEAAPNAGEAEAEPKAM